MTKSISITLAKTATYKYLFLKKLTIMQLKTKTNAKFKAHFLSLLLIYKTAG